MRIASCQLRLVKPVGVADQQHAIGGQHSVDECQQSRPSRRNKIDQEIAAKDHVVRLRILEEPRDPGHSLE